MKKWGVQMLFAQSHTFRGWWAGVQSRQSAKRKYILTQQFLVAPECRHIGGSVHHGVT